MKNIIYIIILSLLLLLFLPLPIADAAYICRNYEGHDICILKIKRSAKKYWEYQASVSIDGIKQPRSTYNCRGQFKVKKDTKIIPFSKDVSGKMLCSLFK